MLGLFELWEELKRFISKLEGGGRGGKVNFNDIIRYYFKELNLISVYFA